MKKILSAALAAVIIAGSTIMPMGVNAENNVNLNISKSNISHSVSPTLYGAFIEDISKACDGGLVSNLIYNNSFEYNDSDGQNTDFNEASAK